MTTAPLTINKPNLLQGWPSKSRIEANSAATRDTPIWDSPVNQVVVMIAPAECISILRTVLGSVKPDLPAAILILVHGHTKRDRPLVVNLNKGRFPVEAGRAEGKLRNGHALIMQADEFMGVGKLGRLSVSLPVAGQKNQSILLESLATQYGGKVITVVLTKLEPGEAEAIQTIRSRGGCTIALDDSDRGWLDEHAAKVVPDPQDLCLAAEAIGDEIARMVAARVA